MWCRHVAPVAEWAARTFWSTIRRPDTPLATRLTQNNKRAAKGSPPQSPHAQVPAQQTLCAECGKPIHKSFKHCAECSRKNSVAALIEGAKLGRVVAHGAQAQARLRETKRRHDLARKQWFPKNQPAWLTVEVYEKRIQPQLNTASLSQIAAALGVSIPYASDIRKGRRQPHPRHWQPLAKLIGFVV